MNILVIGILLVKLAGPLLKPCCPGCKENISFTIANAENAAAGGRGLTKDVKDEILGSGVDADDGKPCLGQ